MSHLFFHLLIFFLLDFPVHPVVARCCWSILTNRGRTSTVASATTAHVSAIKVWHHFLHHFCIIFASFFCLWHVSALSIFNFLSSKHINFLLWVTCMLLLLFVLVCCCNSNIICYMWQRTLRGRRACCVKPFTTAARDSVSECRSRWCAAREPKPSLKKVDFSFSLRRWIICIILRTSHTTNHQLSFFYSWVILPWHLESFFSHSHG